MGSLKNLGDIEEIQTMLFEIGKSFSLVPVKLHIFNIHILCSQIK